MKINYLWVVSQLLWAATSLAQTKLHPKEEYKLLASANTIILSKGQQDSVKISLLRSKSFKTGEAIIALNLPNEAGLSMTMKKLLAQPDEYMVYMTASADTKAGEYNFVPTCTLRNKTKGIVLKLIIK